MAQERAEGGVVVPPLGPHSLSLYEWVLRKGAVLDVHEAETELDLPAGAVRDALNNLRHFGLLLPASEGGELIPVDPTVAEMTIRAPLEREIRERQQELASLHRQLRPLALLFAESTRSGRRPEGIRVIHEAAEVRQELSLMTRLCTQEMVSMQPGGGRNADTLHSIVAESLAMLERGVALRTLYQHTARASLTTRTYVRAVSGAGGEIRTAAEVFDRIVIFDRETAFVPQSRSPGRPPGASVVTDPTVVGFLYRMFEGMWQSGRVFDAQEEEQQRPTDELQVTILRLMAAGLKDDVISQRLGMAPRTLRRHMKSIMDELDAESRFQVGYRIWKLGLRLDSGSEE
ncbi:LuxR C-terminal-related transcriptional regulator [Streptomyces sp. LP05-1]|uniref:LuxR C-terminal-related transcriptional regulator n=1 Tax=Streptomyces pyxinae TaxID=2970734 RepID=A0ABT2CA40_9ACTN|nr:LuxR C-terminal-related transcriptional regulator [Streptomyces sp. LP05-1]MCS0634255.1 LuxR C-terminal-related transcriptional regulator [Streptomyces sp. LP05-1]